MQDSYIEEMIQDRRCLHRRPELGWTEFETTALIVKRLRKLGFQVLLGTQYLNTKFIMGRDESEVDEAMQRALENGMDEAFLNETERYTGCVGIYNTGRPGPVTAFRFDIDALPIEETDDPDHEANLEGFRSERKGLMHACGHDGHTAVGLAVAHWLSDHRDNLSGTVKLIFQPAEEGARGALPIAESGILDDVDYMIGSHIGNSCMLGEVGICLGGSLATTKLDVNFTGLEAHAGLAPEKGKNALFAACNAATTLAGIPRNSQGSSRISVGELIAGESRNIIPAHAYMQVEVRGETEEVNDYMTENVKRICTNIAKAYDVKCDCQIVGRATTLLSTPKACTVLKKIAENLDGVSKIKNIEKVAGSEDCTWLVRKVVMHGGEGAMFLFGCNHNGHHRSDFSIQDRESLPVGFGMFVGFLREVNAKVSEQF